MIDLHNGSLLYLLLLLLPLSRRCYALSDEATAILKASSAVFSFVLSVCMFCALFCAYCWYSLRQRGIDCNWCMNNHSTDRALTRSHSRRIQPYTVPVPPTTTTADISPEPVPRHEEAKLHQEEAPPSYAEALNMKTVIIMDQPS